MSAISRITIPRLPSEVRLFLSPISRQEGEKRREAEQRTLHILLQSVYHGEVDYRHDADGAPYLGNYPNERISVSHSGTHVLFGSSPHAPLGVDIEELGEQVPRVRSRFCSNEEYKLLEATGSPLIALHLLWSAKEAAYKLINPPSKSLHTFKLTGLHTPDDTSYSLTLEIIDDKELIQVEAMHTESYVLAVAL
ncbi:MAG: 4'-phosphopantetheinyl transferase superfamily protein [Porphyromonadaceae bacterium]|nr:4'-phosphopantetheinyl transferase superfamily protein [Porphyromonadaceae bacterium]